VNNVGGLGGRKMALVHEASEEFWDGVVELNIRTTFLCSRAVSREWIKRKAKGVIINIASISGLRGSLRLAPYGAAKAGVMHLTQTLAMELGSHGIRVNCVAPASIQTPDVMAHMTPERVAQTASVMPLRRIGQPEDIGGVVLMLASDLCGYVTGQTLLADGGLSCTSARPPAAW
jgi:NAD(P)-dependent dehydrogenase (short-subunit alcohol dehydrogenase family)